MLTEFDIDYIDTCFRYYLPLYQRVSFRYHPKQKMYLAMVICEDIESHKWYTNDENACTFVDNILLHIMQRRVARKVEGTGPREHGRLRVAMTKVKL